MCFHYFQSSVISVCSLEVCFIFVCCVTVLYLLPGVQNEGSMSELLGNLTDSTFKQISEREDILENVNFGDVFSQLRGVLNSPEKVKSGSDAVANQQMKEQSDVSSWRY